MVPHRIRLIAISLALVTVCAGLALLNLLPVELESEQRAELNGALIGALVLLGPAMLDAVKVELRRLDPSVPAVSDDVRERQSGEHRINNDSK